MNAINSLNAIKHEIANRLTPILTRKDGPIGTWVRHQRKGGKMRSFESWLWVELLHEITNSSIRELLDPSVPIDINRSLFFQDSTDREIYRLRSNGKERLAIYKQMVDKVNKPKGKRATRSVSPDISLRFKNFGVLDIEIKTGELNKACMQDIEKVDAYNWASSELKSKLGLADYAGGLFIWAGPTKTAIGWREVKKKLPKIVDQYQAPEINSPHGLGCLLYPISDSPAIQTPS